MTPAPIDYETMLRLFHGSSVTRDVALEMADRDRERAARDARPKPSNTLISSVLGKDAA